MTQHRPTLSIIILAYNEEDFIGPCLEAIAAQIVAPDEIIVVDNNSSDHTAEIVSQYPAVKLINETEQGMIPARDTGFNIARGDLLARIDADTRLPEGWVAAVHEVFDGYAHGIAGVSGPAYFYEITNKTVRKITSDMHAHGFFKVSRMLLRGQKTLFGSNMIITRKAWLKIRTEVCHVGATAQQEEALLEDIDLTIHLSKYGTTHFSDKLLVGISKRGASNVAWRLQGWLKTANRHTGFTHHTLLKRPKKQE